MTIRLTLRDGIRYLATPAGEATIEPSHQDTKRSRYWRGRIDAVTTPWMSSPRLAAARLLHQLSNPTT